MGDCITVRDKRVEKIIDKLVEEKVIPEHCQRIIIDIPVDDVIRIYTKSVATDSILELLQPEILMEAKRETDTEK